MPPKTRSEPGRSQTVEEWLDSHGVPWTFLGPVDLEEFDLEKGLRNQARLGKPLHEDTVSHYVEDMKNGDVFPGVVAVREKVSRKLVNVDGNHRAAASRLLSRPLATYEIQDVDPQMIVLLTFEANTRHGLPTSEEERLHHALWLVDNGMSIRDAAARLGLRGDLISRERAKAEANRRAVDAGIPYREWEALNNGVKVRLQVISTDEGFSAATRLATQAGLGTEDVVKLVGDVNKSRSAAQQVEIVSAHRQVHAEKIAAGGGVFDPKQGKRQMSARTRYASTVGMIGVLPPADAITERFQEVEVPDQIVKIDKAIARLTEVRTAFEKLRG